MLRSVRNLIGLAALLLVVASLGCSSNNGGSGRSADRPRAEYKMVSAGRVEGDPSGGEPARVSLRWPEFIKTASPAAKDSMDAWIRERLLAAAVENEAPGDTAAIIAQFLDVYRSFRAQYPSAPGGWYLERSVDILSDSLGVVTLDMRENTFGGGAHPNATRALGSFDANGHQLRPADVLVEGKADTLDTIAEVYFRMARQLGPDDNLDQAGFTFPGRFRVGEHVAITPSGMLVYFNEYEIGPHSLGPTEFIVPWPALKGLVREDSPWSALAQ